ncbi:serine/threonine protein kinase, CMGC group [Ceratobasidium sp. 414]|nr:serine/threonine protein kinase, CMGC group [Ceratobasidium sp. 414]
MSLAVRSKPSTLPFIRRRDGALVYSSGHFTRLLPLPIPVPGSSCSSSSGFHSAPAREMDMRDLDKEEDLLDYADGGYLPVHIGDTFKDDRYHVVRKLGYVSSYAPMMRANTLLGSWGHFSTVWLAKDKVHNRHVAIKVVKSAKTCVFASVLLAHRAEPYRSYVTAARDEVGILRFINSVYKDPGHENIVQFLDSFDHKVEAESVPPAVHICMVFEPLGASLLTLIKAHRKGVPEHLVRQIASQILAGLAFLHDRCGVIHTDLKPENIMISLGGKHDIEAIVQAELASSPRSLSRMVGIPPGCVRGGVATPRYGADLAGTKQVWIFGSQPLPTSVSLPRARSGRADGLVRKMSALAVSAMSAATTNVGSAPSSASSSSTLAEALSTAPTSIMSTGKGITFGSTKVQKAAPAVNKVSPVTIVCQPDGHGATVTTSSEETSALGELPEQVPAGDAQTGISDESVGFTKTCDSIANSHKGPSLLSQTAPKAETPLTTKGCAGPNRDGDTIEVKIGDLGNASYCWKHFTENIQTRQYRCPEVILGSEWDATADMWSVGCIFFELLTSDVLFEPAERPGAWSRDDDHICQMIELLGPMSPEFALSGDYSKEMFRSDGVTLRNVPSSKMSQWPLLDVLTQKYRYEQDHAAKLADFLLPFLRLEPKQRTSAQDALRLDWLKCPS